MNNRIARLSTFAAILALGASGAFADDARYDGDGHHRSTHQATLAGRTTVGQQDAFGHAVVGPAARVVVLDGRVRHLNVTQGEPVTFQLPSRERVGWEFEIQSPPTVEQFTWKFDTLGTPTFNLADIAPKHIDVGQVEVHVVPKPLHLGG